MSLSLDHIPPRIDLARIPTPLQPLRRWSEELGVNLMIKRDDLTGAALSGNKIRKLEFALADAQSKDADTVLTCGGEQSNHCRATAIAATMLGLNCRLLLRTADPSNPPPPELKSSGSHLKNINGETNFSPVKLTLFATRGKFPTLSLKEPLTQLEPGGILTPWTNW